METKSNNNPIIWFILLGILIYLMVNFSPFQEPQSKVLSNRDTQVTVLADSRGHYVFNGKINDQRVHFLYDTGATTVAIPEKVANQLGLKRGRQYYSHTANGKAISYATTLREVRVGDIIMRNVQGSIATGMQGNQILLGMSFLNHVEITQFRGKLTLRVRK